MSLVYISPGPVTAQSSVANDLLALVNNARANNGAPPLTLSCTLTQAAQTHLEDMVQNDFFDHVGSDGSTLDQRIQAAGYTGWSAAAENLTWGQTTAEDAFDSWMSSDSHRDNMLNSTYDHMGVAYDPGTRKWVQTFGASGNADCPVYDLNNDNRVTPADAIFALNRLHTNHPTADVDGSGTVTHADVQIITGQIGQIVP